MTELPAHFLRRPPMPTDPSILREFDALFDAAIAAGPPEPIDYRLDAPRWQFICHVADTRPVLLHGSGDTGIARFEPRQPVDMTEFGNQNAVYAASDGLWPMYFAILDRDRHPMWLMNSAARALDTTGRPGDPFYFFSITEAARRQQPWRRGTLYFLPRDGFVAQPPIAAGGRRVQIQQWASLEPVTPLARIEVGAEDFPLLADIRGHDDDITLARIRANPEGFPWLED